MSGTTPTTAFGAALRELRARRRVSQLTLAGIAGVSARHIAFLETGRARPSREMVLTLLRALAVPMRVSNDVLISAGYAPQFDERPLDTPSFAPLMAGLERLLSGHEPYPGLLLSRHWAVVHANRPGTALLASLGVAPGDNLITSLAGRPDVDELITNWASVATVLSDLIRSEGVRTLDDELVALADTLTAVAPRSTADVDESAPAITLHLRVPGGPTLTLFSTIAQFNAPRDVTLADLRLELYFPADETSRQWLKTAFGSDAGH